MARVFGTGPYVPARVGRLALAVAIGTLLSGPVFAWVAPLLIPDFSFQAAFELSWEWLLTALHSPDTPIAVMEWLAGAFIFGRWRQDRNIGRRLAYTALAYGVLAVCEMAWRVDLGRYQPGLSVGIAAAALGGMVYGALFWCSVWLALARIRSVPSALVVGSVVGVLVSRFGVTIGLP